MYLEKDNKLLADGALKQKKSEIVCTKQNYNQIFCVYLNNFEQLMSDKSKIRDDYKTELCDIDQKNLLFPETIEVLHSYIEKLQHFCAKKNKLEIEISHLERKSKKYKQWISNSKITISVFQQDLLAVHNELQYKTKLIEKTKDNSAVNMEMEKYIQSHKILYDKWKGEVTDLISKFKSRISYLKKSYSKAQKENAQLKFLIETHVQAIN